MSIYQARYSCQANGVSQLVFTLRVDRGPSGLIGCTIAAYADTLLEEEGDSICGEQTNHRGAIFWGVWGRGGGLSSLASLQFRGVFYCLCSIKQGGLWVVAHTVPETIFP